LNVQNERLNEIAMTTHSHLEPMDMLTASRSRADIAERYRALTDATSVVLDWAMGYSIQPVPYEVYDPERCIFHRSHWMLDRHLQQGLIEREGEQAIIRDLALSLVNAGYDPASLPDEIYLTDLREWVDQFGFLIWSEWVNAKEQIAERYQAARTLLRENWTSIEALAAAIREQPTLTATEVWEIMLPGVSKIQRSSAYHLAGAAVAGHLVGLSPWYLSIYCLRDRQMSYTFTREPSLPPHPLSEKAVLSLAGTLSSLRATGDVALDCLCGFLADHVTLDPDDTDDDIQLFVEAASRAVPIIGTHWDTIETLATLLLREYCLLGEEISYVLDGGDIKQWKKLH